MPSNHLILCHPLLLLPSIFPNIRVFSNESVLCISIGCESIGVSASVSVLPMNIQDRSPLGWTGWLSLQSKELSRVFSNTTVQKHQFFGAQLSLYQKDPLYTRLRISQFSNLIRSNLRSNLIRLSQYFINMCVGQPYKINMLSANFKPVIVLSQKRK